LLQGKDIEAGRLLLEAKDLLPESERAQINEVIGLEFLGKKGEAHTKAKELLSRYPSSGKLIASLIRTSYDDATLEELTASLPAAVEQDAEARVALALKAMTVLRFSEAVDHARIAVASNPEWFGAKLSLGQALLNSEAVKFGRDSWPVAAGIDETHLVEAIAVMDEAIAIANKMQAKYLISECHIIRAVSNFLLGRNEAAESAFNEAIVANPNNTSAYYHLARFLFNNSRLDEAVVQLRRSTQAGANPDAEYYLANVLAERDAPGDRIEAASIYARLATAGDMELAPGVAGRRPGDPNRLRTACFHSAIEEYLETNRIEEAEQFLERVPAGRFSELSLITARARLHTAGGDLPGAVAAADEALSKVDSNSSDLDLRSLALLLGTLERHKEALPLWLRNKETSGYGNDVRHLVSCADRVKRFDVIMKVAKEAREAGIYDPWLIDREINVLEQFDLDAAIALARWRVENSPGNRNARLRLSFMGLRWGRPDLVEADPDLLPVVEEVTASGGAVVVEILRRHGNPNEALRYAYELVRRHFDDPEANASLVQVFFGFGSRAPEIIQPDRAGPGAAICYVEADRAEKWFVIEDSPVPRQERDEYAPGHSLAVAVGGKMVGDEFVLSKTSGRDRTAIIKEIKNKYLYRMHQITENWQIRFPDQPFIQVFRVVSTDPATGHEAPDFTDIKLIADRRHSQTAEAESQYRDNITPLHLFAQCIGCDPFWALHAVALRPNLPVRCNRGQPDDHAAALQALESCNTLVLDITALAAVSLFQLDALLRAWRGKRVIAQSTATELRATLSELAEKKRSFGHFGKADQGYYLEQRSEEQRESEIQSLTAFVDTVFELCEVRACPELAEIDGEQRDQLIFAFGQHGVESMVIARAPGYVLWTDDLAVGDIAASEFSVRRVWTQVAAEYATTLGILPPDDYLVLSAKQLGMDYQATNFNPFVIAKGGSISHWDVQRWPFSKTIAQLANPGIPLDQILLHAAIVARTLYLEAPLIETRQAALIRMLELLASRQHGMVAVRCFISLLPRLFGVNVLGVDEATGIASAWFAQARKRMRIETFWPGFD
jgi:tetratricopeptide (TPR) repeat protein